MSVDIALSSLHGAKALLITTSVQLQREACVDNSLPLLLF